MNLSEIAKNSSPDISRQDDSLKKIQGKYSPTFILLITILGIAVAEIIAMIVVYFQRHLPYPQQVLIDATVMTAIIFPILYFLSFRPIIKHIRQRYQVEQVLNARLRIIQRAQSHTLDEILQFTLDELESLTGSEAGYFHFIETDQKTIKLQTWSTNTVQNVCRLNGIERHYSLDEAGVWADCIRQKKVVVHNDYASLPNRKGFPEGHAHITREMAVPVIRDGRIMAVLGVGNKPGDYTTDDVEVVSTLADFTWDIIRQKQTADAQQKSEEKFRTLADWTYDWELWLDPEGWAVYCSPSCKRITGYDPNEFAADPRLLLRIVHPEDRDFYEEHHQLVHDESAGVEKIEYRILSQDGSECWIEHICRPVFGENNRYLGRRISNRDITQRRQAEMELKERNRTEKILTQTIHTMQLDIARDLHDTIGQNIGFLRMRLDHLSDSTTIKNADILSELKVMTKAANESYDLIRGTLSVLQSVDTAELFRIFSRYGEQIEERSSLQVEFSHKGEPRARSPGRMRQLFYIFREALTNVEKHARASRVAVQIGWEEKHLNMTIADDGRGFDPLSMPSGSHYGLKFMRERAELLKGSLNVHSVVGTGTKLEARVPYE
jgi:PAS domain S-box-containing protein